MAKRRKNKKDDETLVDLVEAKEHAQDYISNNQTLIISVVAVLLMLIGAYLAYKYLVKEPKVRDAQETIYKAEEQFARDSFALALENPGGEFEGFLDIIENLICPCRKSNL